jgi:hypothetical protein
MTHALLTPFTTSIVSDGQYTPDDTYSDTDETPGNPSHGKDHPFRVPPSNVAPPIHAITPTMRDFIRVSPMLRRVYDFTVKVTGNPLGILRLTRGANKADIEQLLFYSGGNGSLLESLSFPIPGTAPITKINPSKTKSHPDQRDEYWTIQKLLHEARELGQIKKNTLVGDIFSIEHYKTWRLDMLSPIIVQAMDRINQFILPPDDINDPNYHAFELEVLLAEPLYIASVRIILLGQYDNDLVLSRGVGLDRQWQKLEDLNEYTLYLQERYTPEYQIHRIRMINSVNSFVDDSDDSDDGDAWNKSQNTAGS